MRGDPLFRDRCAIDECDEEGTHVLGVRLRKPDFNLAAWAPNTAALLCDVHAAMGMTIQMRLTPKEAPEIEVRVLSGEGWLTRRTLLKDAHDG